MCNKGKNSSNDSSKFFIRNFFLFIQVMLENDVICGAVIQMNIEEYLRFPTMPNQLEFFKTLGKVGSILESSSKVE